MKETKYKIHQNGRSRNTEIDSGAQVHTSHKNSSSSDSSSSNSSNNNNNTIQNTHSSVNNSDSKIKVIRGSIKDAVAGAAAGALAKTAIAPVERVKLLMQLRGSIQNCRSSASSSTSASTSASIGRSTGVVSTSAWNVAKSIYYEEGVLAFWRGNTPNVVRQGGAAALNFMLMDWYKVAITPVMNLSLSLPSKRPHPLRKKRRKILSSFFSGGLAGGTTTTFLYPIEFLRTRLAVDIGTSNGKQTNTTNTPTGAQIKIKRLYPNGMRDVFCAIWKTDGVRGLYQGYGIALSGVVLYRALHLGGFDACKTELLYRRQKSLSASSSDNDLTMTMGERIAIAQIVSIVAGTICYPIDSVRRRLMMQAGLPCNERQYKNSIHAFRKIWVSEGVRGFYLGIGPNLIRSVGSALLLVSYDVFKSMIC